MKAAAYTTHGCDLQTLFGRWDKDGSGALDETELHALLNRMLPGVVGGDTVRRLMQLHAATGHTISTTEAASISWNEGTLFAGLGANTMRTIVRPLLACCLACCTDSQIKLT